MTLGARAVKHALLRPALLCLCLIGCAETTFVDASPAQRQVAIQRMRFLVEAACIENDRPSAQAQVFDKQDFPSRKKTGPRYIYGDPATLIFANIQPEKLIKPVSETRSAEVRGRMCSVGSPAVSYSDANAILQQILSTRLLASSPGRKLPDVISLGVNKPTGAQGYFFEGISYVVGTAGLAIEDENGQQANLPLVSIGVFRE